MIKKYFEGFTKEALDFMFELKFNNNKEWFDLNRDRYKLYLKEPTDLFAADLNIALMSLENTIKTIPSVSRINRDIRFSKNKEPYKDHKWMVFKSGEGRWQSKPTFFFEIAPDSYTYGMGFYEAGAEYMHKYRNKIDANTAEFERLIKQYDNNEIFTVEGEKYKRSLAKDKSDEVMNWYQRKSLAIVSRNNIDQSVFSSSFVSVISDGFKPLIPMYKYLLSITG